MQERVTGCTSGIYQNAKTGREGSWGYREVELQVRKGGSTGHVG